MTPQVTAEPFVVDSGRRGALGPEELGGVVMVVAGIAVGARTLRLVVVALGCAGALTVGPTGAAAYPNPGTVVGDTVTHDPSMLIKPLPVNGAPAAGGDPRYTVFGSQNSSLASN